jgi:Ca-activated chloride channel family protein
LLIVPLCGAALVGVLGPVVQAHAVGQFSARTDLVEVYATVLDGRGRPVRNLRQDAFAVFEDGEPKEIVAFAAGTFPLTLAVGVDRSWSMAGEPLAIARRGAVAALMRLTGGDASMVMAIGSRIETVAALDTALADQRRAVERLDPWGTSPLADGIVAAVSAVDAARGRRALLLWSDGRERYSETSRAEAVAEVRRTRVLVYPIAVGAPVSPLLQDVADESGGRALSARGRREAEAAAETVIEELRHQYLLGYEPEPAKPAGWRRIVVTVADEHHRVRARRGYIAR